MKAAPALPSFNTGELSPLMQGRTDIKNYFTSARRSRNFVVTPQGPMRRRPGTRFVAEVKDSTKNTFLGRFEFNSDQAYILEFGHLYVRFYSLHGVVGAPLELVTPWQTTDMFGADGTFQLRFSQSGDTLYVCAPLRPIQKIVRTGAAAFLITPLLQHNGPFQPIQTLNPTDRYYNNTCYWTGAVAVGTNGTLTFNTTLITLRPGDLVRVWMPNTDSVKQWEPGKVVVLNDVRRSNGCTYHALNGGTTGTIRPTHSYGARFDGDNGVQWQFDDAGYGIVQLTGTLFLGTTVNAVVVKQLPANVVGIGNATLRWQNSYWNVDQGYPSCTTFFRERLLFSAGRKIWASVAGDFENFADVDDFGLVTDDSAISLDITSDRANNIVWMLPSDQALLVGTGGDEHAIYESTPGVPFAPGNTANRKQSEFGSRHCPAIQIGDGTVFVQKSGRRVRDMKLAESLNVRWESPDLAIMADHITKGGIVDMAYQQEPFSVLWILTADRRVSALTINREQEVKGWHTHRFGGYSDVSEKLIPYVESVATIPSPAGDRDEVWFIVNRWINGRVRRYVEWLEYDHETRDDPWEAFYVDSGLSFNGVLNTVLIPGAGATVAGTLNVLFIATPTPVFSVGDIGKHIQFRYPTTNVKGETFWNTADALITGYVLPDRVNCTIISPWPEILNPTGAAGGVLAGIMTNNGNSYAPGTTPAVVITGGGGAGATARVHMSVRGAYFNNFGTNYTPGDILTLDGGTFSRPAKFLCCDHNQVQIWQVIDGGDYTITPPYNNGFGGNTVSGGTGANAGCCPDWQVDHIEMLTPGTGYGVGTAMTIDAPVPVAPFIGSGITAAATPSFTQSGAIGTGTTAQNAANTWGKTVTSISGLGHLEGQLVDILANGIPQPQQRVASGALTLAIPSIRVHVGLPCPAVLQPMPLEAGSANGTSEGKTTRISKITVKFDEAGQVVAGRDEDTQLDTIVPVDPLGVLYTGNRLLDWPDGYTDNALVTMIANTPQPATIAAIYPILDLQDDR